MIFKYLKKREQRKHILAALKAREQEWYHYEVDKRNFQDMIKTAWTADLEGRIAQIESNQALVESVYTALQNRLKEI